jgi:hypothetical protein
MLILYDDVFSPYARKVRIALYEKDVPFERVRALHGDCNQRQAFDPYRVQWRSDRLEWVMKNGFEQWFLAEMRAGRAFFPLITPS